MSTNSRHLQIVQDIYKAFGCGDVPAILAVLHPDVEWRVNVDPSTPGAAAVPIFRACRGPQEVTKFFEALGGAVEFHVFQPHSFLGGESQIAVHLTMESTVRTTGRRSRMDAMHLWTFDADSKVIRFVEFLDTLTEAHSWDASTVTSV